jgi:hypothetical protein
VDKNKSLYDPTRDTVGKIYRDAQLNNTEDYIEVGDMSREIMTSLVEDLNTAFKSFDKKEKPYYLVVHEKKDLQMKNAILRRLIYVPYRPWPEDDTTVFWRDPKTNETRFCWCLPHWSEMDNVLQNPSLFDKEFVYQIKKWKDFDLIPFGFYEHPTEKWIPNPKWKDRTIS